MKLDFAGERLLAVVAHPDDAELLCAGTLARAAADGAAVGICALCQGDKGQTEPPTPDLVSVRRQESAAAAALLGAELLFGDFPDAQLFDAPETRNRLVQLVRQFRPTLLLAHASSDYHADHRAASALTEAASWFSASPGHVTESAPLKEPPSLWWMDTVNMSDFEPEFFVDVSSYVDLKQQMLKCHKSQLSRGDNASFFPLEQLMLQQYSARGIQSGVEAAEAFRGHRAWKRRRAW